MTYGDLLGVPYKAHGRSAEEGFDCYGLVIECCKRAGTPLVDLDYSATELAENEVAKYAARVNVTPRKSARAGYLCEMSYDGNLHLGYMIDKWNVLHATKKGVRMTYIGACKVRQFYEVRNEGDCL